MELFRQRYNERFIENVILKKRIYWKLILKKEAYLNILRENAISSGRRIIRNNLRIQIIHDNDSKHMGKHVEIIYGN